MANELFDGWRLRLFVNYNLKMTPLCRMVLPTYLSLTGASLKGTSR
jgi:hypothetical protein